MTTQIENIIGNQATTGHSVLLGYRVVNERGDEIGTASNYDQAEHIARCYEMKMIDYKSIAESWYEDTFKNMTPDQKRAARSLLRGYGPTPHMLNNAIRCLKSGRSLPGTRRA